MATFVFTRKRKVAVLKRMRELLARPNGWIKDSLHDYEGGYCLLGAEAEALRELYNQGAIYEDDYPDPLGARLSIHRAAKARGFEGVADFNDDPKTRKKDVLALIDERLAELGQG